MGICEHYTSPVTDVQGKATHRSARKTNVITKECEIKNFSRKLYIEYIYMFLYIVGTEIERDQTLSI
jgi:hypothetical protein